jgi:hypothetical protein
MKLQTNPRLPDASIDLIRLLREIANQVNAITEGNLHAHHGAMTAAPTTGEHAVGDFVLNSAPAELGTLGSKYLVHGWRCTVSGTPGTWLPMRVLTGN